LASGTPRTVGHASHQHLADVRVVSEENNALLARFIQDCFLHIRRAGDSEDGGERA